MTKNMITRKAFLSVSAAFLVWGCSPEVEEPRADIGGPFSVIDQDGNAFTEADLAGKPYVMFFGFTHCPDICPYSLYSLGQATELMGRRANDFNYVFVSVDPERDTPEVLKQYAQSNGFPDGLISLTGTQKQIDDMVSVYRIYAQRVDDPSSTGGYTVDHTSYMYIMDKKGDFAGLLRHGESPEDISARLLEHLKTGA